MDKIGILDLGDKCYYAITLKFIKEYMVHDQIILNKIHPIFTNILFTTTFNNNHKNQSISPNLHEATRNTLYYINNCNMYGATLIFSFI